MTSRTRPRINRNTPRPRIKRDLELAANGEVRYRHRRDDLNFFKIPEVAERLRVSTRSPQMDREWRSHRTPRSRRDPHR